MRLEGHIIGIDYDRVAYTNLPRIVGATRWDAMAWLTKSRKPWLQQLGLRFAQYKVHVARRVATQANPSIHYDAVVGDILDEATAQLLADVDFLFLASDTLQSRLVFNALVQQYLIPGTQIGAKVPVEKQTGCVGDIFVATRPVLPGAGHGCLQCHALIPPTRLREEALSDSERRAQRYVEDESVIEPSVITLNVLSAAQATHDVMMMFTGLYQSSVQLQHQMHFVRERQLLTIDPQIDTLCLDCSTQSKSRRARGDRARLPCRMPGAM